MAIQSTPHTQTQQNANAGQSDLEPNQLAQDSGQNDDAALYANREGAQTGGTRAFNANESSESAGGKLPNTQQFTAAMTGQVDSRTPRSDQQGITNRSANEESSRQEKVVRDRPDAQAGVDQKGNSAK
jgi:hypothetical protein